MAPVFEEEVATARARPRRPAPRGRRARVAVDGELDVAVQLRPGEEAVGLGSHPLLGIAGERLVGPGPGVGVEDLARELGGAARLLEDLAVRPPRAGRA